MHWKHTNEEKLPAEKFIRVHRSYIVAPVHITAIQDTVISLGNKLIPIGAVYKEGFYRRLNLL